MKIEDVKKNLNKMVEYGGRTDLYSLNACILRRNDKGFYYQAELLDVKGKKSVLICPLEDVEVIGNE